MLTSSNSLDLVCPVLNCVYNRLYTCHCVYIVCFVKFRFTLLFVINKFDGSGVYAVLFDRRVNVLIEKLYF